MIPYAEKLVSDFLRSHASVVALGARVVSKTPPATEEPWVRVTRLDALNEERSRPEHLIDFMLQFDCYASADNGSPEASLLGRTVRAALHDDLPGTSVADAVVTAVRIAGDSRQPDTTFTPARERIALTAIVWAHSR